MSYQFHTSGVIRLQDGAWIPADERNSEWQSYLAWTAEGNTAKDPEPQIPVSKKLTVESLAELLKSKGQIDDAEIEAALK